MKRKRSSHVGKSTFDLIEMRGLNGSSVRHARRAQDFILSSSVEFIFKTKSITRQPRRNTSNLAPLKSRDAVPPPVL